MPLHRLYNLTTGSANPSSLTGILPGGAGVQVAGVTVNPGISAPRLEESTIEVLDVTAPTNLGAAGTAAPTPAIAGKLLVMDWANSTGGAKWKQNTVANQTLARGQYGIVFVGGSIADAGTCVGSSSGNISQGTKAVVMYDGPTQAYVQTTVGGVSVGLGTPLAADGAGNLTPYTGSAAGAVLARSLGNVAASVSIPVLVPVYVGGY